MNLRYVGDWHIDERHGKGEHLDTDGTHYIGNWKDHWKHGSGIWRLTHSDIVKGFDSKQNGLKKDDGDISNNPDLPYEHLPFPDAQLELLN